MSYGDLYSDNLKFFDVLKIKCFKEFMADIQYISSLDEGWFYQYLKWFYD